MSMTATHPTNVRRKGSRRFLIVTFQVDPGWIRDGYGGRGAVRVSWQWPGHGPTAAKLWRQTEDTGPIARSESYVERTFKASEEWEVTGDELMMRKYPTHVTERLPLLLNTVCMLYLLSTLVLFFLKIKHLFTRHKNWSKRSGTLFTHLPCVPSSDKQKINSLNF